MSRFIRRGLVLGAVAGVAYAAWRNASARAGAPGAVGFTAQPFPMPPMPVAARTESGNALELPRPTGDAGAPVAVEPADDGSCPIEYPIKGKLSTGIYHPPGAFAYDRTRADRCYRDESAAESDGLRAAKR